MTGYPWIDAIMRQLKTEGWIHHLARHAVACFLTRGDLWISWEEGQQVVIVLGERKVLTSLSNFYCTEGKQGRTLVFGTLLVYDKNFLLTCIFVFRKCHEHVMNLL